MNKALLIALTQYGIKEIPGAQHEPEVMKYFHDIGFTWVKDDETAWCSAFVSWCMKKAAIPHKPTLRSLDWLSWGTPVMEPVLGDLVIFTRGEGFGHVGFYINRTSTGVYVLGGNQSNMVNIQLYSGTNLLGYRRYVNK